MTYSQYQFSARDTNNKPLSYGKVYLYKSKSVIPVATYSFVSAVLTKNVGPAILDSNGAASNIFISNTDIGPFTMNLTDSNDNQQLQYPVDGITTGLLQTVTNFI